MNSLVRFQDECGFDYKFFFVIVQLLNSNWFVALAVSPNRPTFLNSLIDSLTATYRTLRSGFTVTHFFPAPQIFFFAPQIFSIHIDARSNKGLPLESRRKKLKIDIFNDCSTLFVEAKKRSSIVFDQMSLG